MTSTPQLHAQNSGLPTFDEAKANTALQTAAGNCSNTQEFADKLNAEIQALMIRGDWPGTLLPIQIEVQGGVVTFPRYVASVRAFNLCRHGVPVVGVWYSFINHYWLRGTCCHCFQNWVSSQSPRLEQMGTGVCFAQIPSSTCVLKVYCLPQDVGVVIQFFGTNPSGQALTTTSADLTTITDGISITCNNPFVLGTDLVANISRVIKPVTQGPITVSALDTMSGVETPIASFDAGDTNPGFAQYRLHASQCTTPQPTFHAVALVKLKYIPVVAGTDLVTIPNLTALAMMLKARRFREAGDRANFLAYQADAVKELNLQLGDTSPDYQIPINVNPFGSASPRRAGIGRIM